MPATKTVVGFLSLIAIAQLAGPVDGFSQTIPSSYRFVETAQEAGVGIGVLNPDAGRFDYGPGSGQVTAAQYTIRVGGPFSLQGVVNYLPTTRDVIDPRRDEGDRQIGEADATVMTTDLRLHFTLTGDRTWRRLAPYVVAGGGAAFDFSSLQTVENQLEGDDRFEFGPSFLGVLGTGIGWYLSDRIVARGEAIATYWKLNTPRGYLRTDRELGDPPEGEWVSGVAFTVGAAYRF